MGFGWDEVGGTTRLGVTVEPRTSDDVAPSNFEVQSATEGIDDCGGNLRNEGSRTLADVAPSNFEGPRTTTCKCNATEGIDDCTRNLRNDGSHLG